MSYEHERERLQNLMEEFLSGEDSDCSVSDKDYEDSDDDESSSSSSQEVLQRKKRKSVLNKDMPSTSKTGGGSSTIDDIIDTVISQYQITQDESSSEEESNTEKSEELSWKEVDGKHLHNIPCNIPDAGFINEYFEMFNKKPNDFFQLFMDDNIFELIVEETNRYAQQNISKGMHGPSARIHKWTNTNKEEIKTFFSLLIWMGLKKLPKLSDYWSKNPLYANKISSFMSRNRFQLLLGNLHFSDNETSDKRVRLYKLAPLLEKVISNFKKVIVPGECLCIDESIIPFRGRLSFRQYIKNKKHKFGVKVYKLCLDGGFTYDLQIYSGNDKTRYQSVPDTVVFHLSKDLLDSGRTIYTDNFYTSVTLAHSLLKKRTHLVGTLRQNRRHNPTEVTKAKLKKGEIIGRESNTGVVVSKWKDKRDVLMLSTKHTLEMVDVRQRGGVVRKPSAIFDYNKSKGYIDISDQMKSYSTALRKSVKWYRKIAIELLLGSALVNSYIMHQQITNQKMSITSFKEELVGNFLDLHNFEQNNTPRGTPDGHHLEEVPSTARRRCATCYAKLSRENGRKFAQNKTPFSRFKCIQCDKFYCIICFCDVHSCNI